MPEAAAVVLRDVGEGLQDVDGHHDDVVEVEGVGLAQAALVLRVGRGDRAVVVVALGDLRGVGLLVDELVLEVAHLVREAARRVALGVEVEVAQHEAHEALAVGGVVDREGRLHADLGGLAPQDAHARGVEGHHPHRPGAGADEGLDPLAHLGGGLVGEGDREDLARLRAALAEQPRDAVGQHARLARARARDDEQRGALVHDGLALVGVEPLEQRLGVEVGMPCARVSTPPRAAASAHVGTPCSVTP